MARLYLIRGLPGSGKTTLAKSLDNESRDGHPGATTNEDNMPKAILIRAKAFSGESVRVYDALVESDGTVLVWDSVAGQFTSCHDLSASAVRLIVSASMDKGACHSSANQGGAAT